MPRPLRAGASSYQPSVQSVYWWSIATAGGWTMAQEDQTVSPAQTARQRKGDVERLHELGYAQELLRAMGGFSNFAVSFTIISILAGCLTSYFIAFNNGGPVAVEWGWLI